MDQITSIPVTGPRPYQVVVGRDLLPQLRPLAAGATRGAVLHPPRLKERADAVAGVLGSAGLEVRPVEVPNSEEAKTPQVAAHCWDELAAAGVTRDDLVIGLGGGATTDLAGFVAATWLRGVRWIALPTSLLGMVDAAVGGKTGVNTAAGKNLVGAFHPPAAVLADLADLDSLPAAERVAGLAEVVKCGFIADPAVLDLIEADPAAATNPRSPALRELVERSIRVKAEVVSADLREAGPREVLNYGHTLAHAIERVEGYRWRHGEAVAVGLVYAAILARLAGRLDAGLAARHRSVLRALGLPVRYQCEAWPDLLAAMRVDKKSRGSVLRFVVLDHLAAPSILEGPPDDLLALAYKELCG